MNQQSGLKESFFTKRKCLPWLLTLLMATALVAVVVISRGWQVQKLVAHYETNLQTAPDASVPLLLDKIAEFGDDGIPALVRALGSDRQAVSRLARGKLSDLFSKWEQLPPDQATRKISIFAETLAKQVDQFDTLGKRVAADYAERILLIRTDERVISRATLIAHCDSILRKSITPGAPRQQIAQRSSIPFANSTTSEESSQNKQFHSLGPLPELPGGGIPIDPINPPNRIQTPKNANPLTENKTESKTKNIVEPGRIYPNLTPPKKIAPEVAQQPSPETENTKQPLRNDSPQTDLELDKKFQTLLDEGKPLPYAELIIQLQSKDPNAASSAAKQLQQLGFDRYRLAISWEMRHTSPSIQKTLLKLATDTDAAVRLRLARTLPRSQGLKTWPWLIWLSMDDDADVRREAVVHMKKIDHLEIRQRLKRIANLDSEDSIKQMAKRILETTSELNRRQMH